MKIRNQDITIPTSMVGNYPNPRWWDAEFARHFSGDQEPPDALVREALEDVVAAVAKDQEIAGLDIIALGTMAAVSGYSKGLETESDNIGFQWMVAAGYEPQ